jgi:hypothetical protein
MEAMAGFFQQLEKHTDLEPSIIRTTKVHKVLKGIIKLSSIPKDEEYNFKTRSTDLLEIWNKRMAADGDAPPPSATEPKAPMTLPVSEPKAAPQTNGDDVMENATPAEVEPMKEESEAKEGAQKEVEQKAEEVTQAIDAKVEEAAATEEPTPAPVPAEPKDSMDVPKDVEMGDAGAEEVAEKKPEAAAEATTATV